MNPYLMRGLVGAGLGGVGGALGGGHGHRLEGALGGALGGGALGAASAHWLPSSAELSLGEKFQRAVKGFTAGDSGLMEHLKTHYPEAHAAYMAEQGGMGMSGQGPDLGPAGPSKLGAFYQQGRDEAFRRFVR